MNKTVIDIENCFYDKDVEIDKLKQMLKDATVENKRIQNEIVEIDRNRKSLKAKIQELEKETVRVSISLEEKIKENELLEKNYLKSSEMSSGTVEELREITLFDEIKPDQQLEIKNLKEINDVNRKHIIFMRLLNVSYIGIIIYLLVEYYDLHF